MQMADDTIVAVSTPAGRGGIGIVRLSGAGAKEIAESMVRLKRPLEAGRARFGVVLDEGGAGVGSGKAGGAGRSKNVMRGSLHFATHGEAVRRSGRDDASSGARDDDSRAGTARRDDASWVAAQGREDGSWMGTAARDDASLAVLDEAVVTYFRGPRSYTGEDVVEIAVHGAPVLLDALVRRCVAAGARLARPGEFTERAFLAGRIDLTQAEAVDDLIQATTLEQARTAARQMGGGLSRQVLPVKQRLIELIAAMEAGIDFAEDDVDVLPAREIATALREVEAPLVVLEESFAYGRVLKEGFRLTIVGRPNAGKSSLFNRLVHRERAIVTAQPGTTRDTVTERLEFAGIPVELVDTAGLRQRTTAGSYLDEAEALGVARSREAMAEADVVLLVVAADTGLHEEDMEVVQRAEQGSAGLVVVLNKVDLVRGGLPRVELPGGEAVVVETSAVEGTGIEELRAAVLGKLRAIAPEADTAPLTNMRQHGAISSAVRAVRAAMAGVELAIPHEMVLIDLHEVLEALDELTGTTHTEEILGIIFSRFCIGK